MPHLVERCFRAAGVEMADLLRLEPVDPMYRAVFADGSELFVRQGREAMTEEVRRQCGAHDAAAFERFCDWLGRLYRTEMPHFIERNHDGPLDLVRPLGPAARPGAARRVRPARRGGGAPVPRRAAAAAAQLPVALRRPGALRGARPVRGHHLHGRGQRRRRPGGRDARAPRGPGHRGGQGRRPAALRGARRADPAGRGVDRDRCGACAWRAARWSAADAVVCNPDLPVAYRTLVPGLPPPRAVRRGRYSPSAVVWHAGVRGPLPRGRPTTTSTSGARGTPRSARCSATGAACPSRRGWSASRR